ncbi:MAG TPA: tetratricopeptide repeat protein [Sumerlaeia bacterium]|nr:tetratricopeptide repeat protein [Sumerlaeia bacterium]
MTEDRSQGASRRPAVRWPLVLSAILALILSATGCRRKSPNDVLEDAIELTQRQDVIGAIVKCENLIERWPDDPAAMQARLLLGQNLARNGEAEEARRVWGETIEKAGIGDQIGQLAYTSRIHSWVVEGNLGAAIAELSRTSPTLSVSPDLANRMQGFLGELYFTNKQPQEGKAVFLDLVRSAQNETEVLRPIQFLAEILSREGYHAQAAEVYQDYLKERPDSEHRGVFQSDVARFLKKAAEGAEDPALERAYVETAGQAVAASVEYFTQEIATEPLEEKKREMIQELVRVLSLDKRYGEAIDAYRKYLEENPGSPYEGALLIQMAELHNHAADELEGEEAKKAERERANDARRRAIAFYEKKRDASEDPKDKIAAILEISKATFGMGESAKALDILKNCLQSFPDAEEQPVIMTHIAEIHYLDGDLEQSKEWYAKIATMFPQTRVGQSAQQAFALVSKQIEEKAGGAPAEAKQEGQGQAAAEDAKTSDGQ